MLTSSDEEMPLQEVDEQRLDASINSTLIVEFQRQIQSLKQTVNDLRALKKEFDGLQDLKTELINLRHVLESERANATTETDETIVSERNWSHEAIDCEKNVSKYVSKHRDWTLIEEEDNQCSILQCVLCADWNSGTASKRKGRNGHFAEGIQLTREQLENKAFCYKQIRQMVKHEMENKEHLALCKVVKSAMEQCSTNILVKSEVSYLMFSRAEPSGLFAKLMQLLHRISNLDGCVVDVGSYGHSWNMVKSWRRAYAFFVRVNLTFVFRSGNSCDDLQFYSVSIDGWSRGPLSVQVMIAHTLFKHQPRVFLLNLSSFRYTPIESVHTTRHKVDQIFAALKEFGLNCDPEGNDIFLSTATDYPYLHAKDPETNEPVFKTEILKRLTHPEFFIDAHYDRAHKREGVRRSAAKSNPAVSCYIVIAKKGIKNLITPKWSSMQQSLDSSLNKLVKFSETRFWVLAG